MSTPKVDYETYASHPTKDGPMDLRVKIYRPEESDKPLPLLIWFHAGGFRTGDIESTGHERISRLMTSHGYACAFVQYRLRGRAEDLNKKSQALLPDLIADAQARASDVNPDFVGSRALAAMEDGFAFLNWLKEHADAQGFSGHYILGGSSAGGMTVLNMLNLAPHLGYEMPEIATAIVLSGAFAYPSYFSAPATRTLALVGANESQMPATSLRAYAYLLPDTCVLLEHDEHQHGDPRITRQEPLRRAARRFVEFDRGTKKIASARMDRPDHKPKRDNRFCIFTCVRNEGAFLLEWIAHNRAIGVTDFVIFSNDCDDGTTELLEALDRLGIVKHVPNPSMALGSDQHLGIAVHCAQYTHEFRKSDYAILTDVDEFIQINVADGTLNGLLATCGHPDVISLSELLYGFGGVEKFENRLITSQFQVSDDPHDPANPRRGVKSIMRVSRDMGSYSNHRPRIKAAALDKVDWVDGAGNPAPKEFITEGKRGLDIAGRYALARVNHYTLRSGESMLVKFERGDAVRPGRMREKYFQDRNGRAIRNEDFLPHLPPLKAELARLLKEPELLHFHRVCVNKHAGKIAALKAHPDFTEVWQAIQEELQEPVLSELVQPAAE